MAQTEPTYSTNNPTDLQDFVDKNYWKIRNCADYRDEYTECTSIKGRFQQYFVHGEAIDCSGWKEDFNNCKKAGDNLEAAARVIHSEDERRKERLKLHLANDVWVKREEPPSNWNDELPDFLLYNQKDSFLPVDKGYFSKCTIS